MAMAILAKEEATAKAAQARKEAYKAKKELIRNEQVALEMEAEALAAEGAKFDVVLNMEVVEHVQGPLDYLTFCQQLLRQGGLMVCSTINRNAKSFAMAIIGAEYIMCWLPKGTHEWNKFITPDELFTLIEKAGLEPVDRKGFVFNPITWKWRLSDHDLSVNYVTASLKS